MFDRYLDLWGLDPDGAPIVTRAARLLPVRRTGEPAMLKIVREPDEKPAGDVLAWWDGQGAVRVLAMADDAVLLERAMGGRSLAAFAREQRDAEATHILCEVIARLHAPRLTPPPAKLAPLSAWFQPLDPVAAAQGGVLMQAADAAHELLAEPRDVVVLHGDVHHDNVLDFGPRGWLAIDPKRVHGERGFDYANLFCNPDVGDPSARIAVEPEAFARRLDIVATRSGIQRRRLLQWILAWTGLSAAWFIGDDESPEVDLAISALALAALRRD